MNCCKSLAQQAYWQQRVDYKINVSLDDKTKTLTGDETIHYTNNSPDTLHYIPFHLWANAYKNDKTAYSEQSVRQGNTAFYFSGEEQRGYINQLLFKVNDIAANTITDSLNIDIVKLILSTAISTGANYRYHHTFSRKAALQLFPRWLWRRNIPGNPMVPQTGSVRQQGLAPNALSWPRGILQWVWQILMLQSRYLKTIQ